MPSTILMPVNTNNNTDGDLLDGGNGKNNNLQVNLVTNKQIDKLNICKTAKPPQQVSLLLNAASGNRTQCCSIILSTV